MLEGLGLGFIQDPETLETVGRLYGALLHLQLAADLFVVVFLLLLIVWPKAGAVALAAFRNVEVVRRPILHAHFLPGVRRVGIRSRRLPSVRAEPLDEGHVLELALTFIRFRRQKQPGNVVGTRSIGLLLELADLVLNYVDWGDPPTG